MERALLVRAALEEVSRWRSYPRSQSDEAICSLLASYSLHEQLADLLWADLPPSACPQDVADLLSMWFWRTADNGAAIRRTTERWIEESADSKKIAVALNLEAYPFLDDEVRLAKLKILAAQFPEHRARCESIVDESQAMMRQSR